MLLNPVCTEEDEFNFYLENVQRFIIPLLKEATNKKKLLY